MKKTYTILLAAVAAILINSIASISTDAYFLGLKSRDNSIENIQWVEKNVGIELPVVSFIFDPRNETAYNTMAKIPYTLGRQKIYHITIAPGMMTAKDVADGKADESYKNFFELVKQLHIKVVFRTMHEMNWGWYPRSSDPANFAKAWQRVRHLSRDAWLTKQDILFDMSVNGWDMPTRDSFPNQQSQLMYCYPAQKHKLNCPTFEDYYPGDDYVDLMWFTFYNRGKGHANRLWQQPYEIVSHPQWKLLERIKKIWKPLFVDEVWTTAVWYNETYNQKKSQEVFANDTARKDVWLDNLRTFLDNESQIVWAIYFNVDLTYWLQHWQIGEADWSIFDVATNKMYEGGKRLFSWAIDNNLAIHPLLDLFWVRRTNRWKKPVFLSKLYGTKALALLKSLDVTPLLSYSWGELALTNYTKKIEESNLSASKKRSTKLIIDEARRIIAQ